MKRRHFIDTHKGLTGLFILSLMGLYRAWWNPTAWIYLALHGTYGLLWVLKSRYFPDKRWEEETGWGYALIILGGLSLYWIAPWLIISRGIQAPPWLLGLSVAIYGLGVFFHFSVDMQKHTALRLRPETLITEGLFSLSRNMNYFGELLIYLAFVLLAQHWAPLLILALFIGVEWIPNMIRKDRSLARYPNFEEYRRSTPWFLPIPWARFRGSRAAGRGQAEASGPGDSDSS